jgi:DNA-binding MarR family transcriptional regulator
MSNTENFPFPLEVVEISQRLFRLRNRFRVGMPENLTILKKRIRASQVEGKFSGVGDFDTFFKVGMAFSRYNEPITMGELSRDLEVPLSTATRMVDWFVKNEYAERLPDAQDRRVVRVTLTEAGQEVYRTINQTFMESIQRLVSPLTPEERGTFFKLLCKVLDTFEKEIQG